MRQHWQASMLTTPSTAGAGVREEGGQPQRLQCQRHRQPVGNAVVDQRRVCLRTEQRPAAACMSASLCNDGVFSGPGRADLNDSPMQDLSCLCELGVHVQESVSVVTQRQPAWHGAHADVTAVSAATQSAEGANALQIAAPLAEEHAVGAIQVVTATQNTHHTNRKPYAWGSKSVHIVI